MIRTLTIALLLASPGDTAIRTNIGKIIPKHAANSPTLLLLVEEPVVGHFPSVDGIENSRTSSGTFVSYDGGGGTQVETAPADTVRVETDGILIEGESINEVVFSQDPCAVGGIDNAHAPWGVNASGGSSCSVNTGIGPDGAAADVFTGVGGPDGGTSGGLFQTIIVSTAMTTGTLSVWMKRASGTGLLPVSVGNLWLNGADGGTTCTCVTINHPNDNPISCESDFAPPASSRCVANTFVTDKWTRVSVTITDAVEITPISGGIELAIRPYHIDFADNGGVDDNGSGTVVLGGSQFEEGGGMTSYVPTGGTRATRGPDTSSIDNVVLTDALDQWCVTAVVKPAGSAAWPAFNRAIWSVGTNGAANSARTIATTAGDLTFDHFDSAGVSKTFSGAHNWAPASSQMPRSQKVAATISLPGIPGTTSGTGTVSWNATPATFYFGTLSTTGTELNGYMKNFQIFGGVCP